MKTALIHFSDFHISSQEDFIVTNVSKIAAACRPLTNLCEKICIIVTGDIIDQGNVAAYTEIAGNIYWTTIDQLFEHSIYIIDPKGVETLHQLGLPNLRLVTVYINTPDDIRKERALNKRGDDRLVFMKRDMAEREQFRIMLRNADFDYAISNIDAAKAYSVLRWISQVEGVWKNNLEEEV